MKTMILILLIALLSAQAYSQESMRVEWEIYDNTMPLGGIIDNAGNTIIVGLITKKDTYNDTDAFIFKMDTSGNYMYDRIPEAPDTSITYKNVIQLTNGNYFVIGRKGPSDYNNDSIQRELVVAIYDKDLNLLVDKRYNYNDIYKMLSGKVIQESDDNILYVCSAQRKNGNPMNNVDLGLIRLTTDGDTIETRFQHFQRNVSVYDIDKIPASSNYLILEFITQMFGSFECMILKPDLTVDTINYFSSHDYTVGNYITCDYWYPDKTFLMGSGMSVYDKSDEFGLAVYRCDTLANISDSLFLNKAGVRQVNSYIECMSYADEKSIYVVGHEPDFLNCHNNDSINLYVVDTGLNQVAYKSLGGDESYDTFGVLTSKDHGAYIYGQVWYPDGDVCTSNLAIYHVSREDLGLPPVKVLDLERPLGQAKVYPNPVSRILNISVDKRVLQEHTRIKLFNSQGKKVYDYRLPHKGNTLQLDVTNLEPGLYIYNIASGKQVLVKGKFVKQ